MQQRLIFVRGLPGAGKSTLAEALVRLALSSGRKAVVVEADQYFTDPATGEYRFDRTGLSAAHQWCQRTVEYWLKDGATVVVSNTFTQRWEMEPYLALAHRLRVPVQVVEVRLHEASPADYAASSVHGVPVATVERMAERWEEVA